MGVGRKLKMEIDNQIFEMAQDNAFDSGEEKGRREAAEEIFQQLRCRVIQRPRLLPKNSKSR